jgi:hypothetical protein
MGTIVTGQDSSLESDAPVRCPVCAQPNQRMRYCRHVRWTFDQGGPLDFARFAVETSPYVRARGHKVSDIPSFWWDERGEWVVDRVMLHFDASNGYVFGELSDLDLLARDIWKAFHPDPERPQIQRVDPI